MARRALVALLALALLAACLLAAPARAAFPGRNGLLVAVPERGPGLILAHARGPARARRICAVRSLCGLAGQPRFAPDGNDIAYIDRARGRPVVVAADGTCMWCLLGPPLTRLRGRSVTFTGDGLALGLSGSGGLVRVPLTGSPARGLVGAPVREAAWSASGAFAFVRGATIWLGRPGRAARRLAFGTSPDFSPDGRRVAFADAGWIWEIATSGGAALRLVRGGDPVFSPDGRELAFIGPGGRVYVAGARGRHPRPVRGLRARSLDWQPLPRHRRQPCAVPAGSTLVA
ncbi:MAG TPA: hypothetical protein VE992_03150, partial [Solirubrobacteraceae bacterium]|nr:hypothetical protein [Solirubrobacteraceae bacterium]